MSGGGGRLSIRQRAVAGIPCPACRVPAGTQCVDLKLRRTLTAPHPIRVVRWREVEPADDRQLPDRWATCSRQVNPSVAAHRHLVRPGGLTTVCGASASSPWTWRGDKRKPKCPTCLQRGVDPEAPQLQLDVVDRVPAVEQPAAAVAAVESPGLPGTVEAFPDVLQRSDEWYDLRCGMVTASAIGRLLTVRTLTAVEYECPECDAAPGDPCQSKTRAGRPNKTVHPERTATAVAGRATSPLVIDAAGGDDARAVVTVAAAERITGFVDPTYVSLDMQRGNDEEPFAVAAYSEHHAHVSDCGFMVRRWDGFALGYSPDGLVGTDGAIEVKARRGKRQVETVLSGRVPAENLAQLQAGLFVSGRAWIDYVSYSGGMHLWKTRVTPDPLWHNAIRAAVEAFESDVTATVDAYLAAVVGLPLTERPDLDMVV